MIQYAKTKFKFRIVMMICIQLSAILEIMDMVLSLGFLLLAAEISDVGKSS